jgi:hypothetical protein
LEEEPGLYFRLAELEPTPDAILKFVGQYGKLGHGQYKRERDEDGDLEVVEPFGLWEVEIRRLHYLTELWWYAKKEDATAIARFARWENDGIVFRWSGFEWFHLNSSDYWTSARRNRESREKKMIPEQCQSGGVPLFRRGEVITPALLFIQHRLDIRLSDSGIKPRLTWSDELDRAVLANTPRTLLDAIWLQFAIDFAKPTGSFRIGQCAFCGNRFQIGPGQSRKDRTTCSNSCRTLRHLQRKDQARELHEKGRSVK